MIATTAKYEVLAKQSQSKGHFFLFRIRLITFSSNSAQRLIIPSYSALLRSFLQSVFHQPPKLTSYLSSTTKAPEAVQAVSDWLFPFLLSHIPAATHILLHPRNRQGRRRNDRTTAKEKSNNSKSTSPRPAGVGCLSGCRWTSHHILDV